MEGPRLALSLFLLCVSALAALGGVTPRVKTMPVSPNATVAPEPRIIGGSRAYPGMFPYQAAIFIDDTMFCGGSLISEKYILTAGHCVDGGSHWIIYLGSVDLTASESGRQIAQSVDSILHEDYSKANLANDVALLVLRVPVDIDSYVQPVDLATVNSGDFVTTSAIISGWGKTSDYTNLISEFLYYTQLTVISNAECYKIYGTVVQDWTVCASGLGVTNPCNGDSGGALVVNSNGRPLQIGVTSFASTPKCLTYPSGYARVSYYRNWIKTYSGV